MPIRRKAIWTLIACFSLLAGVIPAASGAASTFVAQADSACQARGQAVAADNQIVVTSASSAAAYSGDLAGAWQHEVSKLSGLTPPAAVKGSFEGFLSDERSILADLKAAKKAAKQNNSQAYTADGRAVLITQKKSLPKAAGSGLPICAQKLSSSNQKPIKNLAVAGSVHPKASMCATSVTKHYLDVYWQGSVSKCRHGIVKNPATSATVTQVFGIVPGAWLYLTQSGVPASHRKALLFFVKQNGTWKLNTIEAQP